MHLHRKCAGKSRYASLFDGCLPLRGFEHSFDFAHAACQIFVSGAVRMPVLACKGGVYLDDLDVGTEVYAARR